MIETTLTLDQVIQIVESCKITIIETNDSVFISNAMKNTILRAIRANFASKKEYDAQAIK